MISVVIPTLNEADNLPPLLHRLQVEPTPAEIVVVDGGSSDATARIAMDHGVRLLSSPAGRGRQLAAGAAATKGEVLLFLHADSRFPKGGLGRIRAALDADPNVVGGNFRLLFDGNEPFSKWLNGFYAWIRSHGVYYGDSGVFVRRSVYEAIGGIRPLALMEDFDFIRRLERSGRTCCIADPPLVTSSRRFHSRRPAAIVFGWLKIHALFYLGVRSETLARLYNSARH
ncbi:MAG: TIGR04283 family arsenosugar biosynthesis glycosyltransferase [Minwuiales bacterium]|nr:TIGR04283 family arsenosugar biosynthesis glycosyltransferase [Minwuiales bacterium]